MLFYCSWVVLQFAGGWRWWDRKGENEIDIIYADELEQKVTFYEVKRQAKDINIGILKDKAVQFFNQNRSLEKNSCNSLMTDFG